MRSAHITLELILLKQANQTIAVVRRESGNTDLKQALANVGTVLNQWIELLEKQDDEPHQTQRRD